MFQLNMENIMKEYFTKWILTSMPSLQLGVDVVLDLRVSPLDGGERLIAVDQLSTKVNVFFCTTWESRSRCRVTKCKGRQSVTLSPNKISQRVQLRCFCSTLTVVLAHWWNRIISDCEDYDQLWCGSCDTRIYGWELGWRSSLGWQWLSNKSVIMLPLLQTNSCI